MIRKYTFILGLLLAFINIQAQDIYLYFEGYGESQVIDSITIKNLNTGDTKILSGSDMLTLIPTNAARLIQDSSKHMIMYPNPSQESCNIDVEVPISGLASLEIFDISGKLILKYSDTFSKAIHSFKITGLGGGVFYVVLSNSSYRISEKLISTSTNLPSLSISYSGYYEIPEFSMNQKSTKENATLSYSFGDVLWFEAKSDNGHKTINTLIINEDDVLPTQGELSMTFNFKNCVDNDGYIYSIVEINDQTWMAENLRTETYSDGTSINNISDNDLWINEIEGAYCTYDNLITNVNLGRLYNWAAVSNTKNICPTGWHVPTDNEWKTLEAYLGITNEIIDVIGWHGDNQGCMLKDAGTEFWISQTGENVNAIGFNALPAGIRNFSGNYYYLGRNAAWWTATENHSLNAWSRGLQYDKCEIYREDGRKVMGLSVRCVQDEVIVNLPELTTDNITNIGTSYATGGGNITDNGGSALITKGLVWSTTENPSILNNEGITDEGSEIGLFTSSLTNLQPNTLYYVKAYATNSEGTAYGEEVSFNTLEFLFTPGNGVTDVDGNYYNSIIINGTEWMASNLYTTTYKNGDDISEATSNIDWENSTFGVYCWYENNVNTYGSVYGALYNWLTVETENLCPMGWHVPDTTEFQDLITFLGGEELAGGTMKETGNLHWNNPNEGAINTSGFTALPGGYRETDGIYADIGISGHFWTSTIMGDMDAYKISLYDSDASAMRYHHEKNSGTSVRCVKNADPLPILSTANVSNITATTATCGGNLFDTGGFPITDKGLVWSTSVAPDLTTNEGSISMGEGFSDFTTQITDLLPNTTYYIRAYASNQDGSSYGQEVSFNTGTLLFTEGDGFSDPENNEYKSIVIGDQEWQSENLRTTLYRDGTPITKITDPTEWNNLNTGAYCWYDNDSTANDSTYSKLYNWYAVNSGKICPYGWHVSTLEEWQEIINLAGGNNMAGAYMKSTGTIELGTGLWYTPNTGANNESGFDGFPGGLRNENGNFNLMGYAGNWWSSSAENQDSAFVVKLHFDTTGISIESEKMKKGYSVRCIKNDYIEPTLTTIDVIDITPITATVNCEITDDGGNSVTARGVVWSTSTEPSVENNEGMILEGEGLGTYSCNLTDLTAGTTYYVRAYATNDAGTAYGNELTFSSLSLLFTPGDGVIDYDGNEYETIIVNGKEYMAENLRTSSYNFGSPINKVTDNTTWNNTWDGAYCWYNNDSTAYEELYGKLYNFYVMQEGEICPDGWSVMTDEDFTDLELFLGLPELESDAMGWRGEYVGGSLKEMGTEFWLDPNLNATNISGFSALPSGYRDVDGQFYNIGSDYYVWALTFEQMTSKMRSLNYNENRVYREDGLYNQGFSIRCKKVLLAEVSTTPVTNITYFEAQSGGNITSDGGGSIYSAGIIWSTSPNPTIESNEGYTEDAYWIGSFESYATQLSPETTYFLRAYATNDAGTAYGNEEIFTTNTITPVFTPGGGVIDYDGNEYETIIVNGKEYMAENLRTSSYNYGGYINKVTDNATWSSMYNGAYCWYDNDSTAYEELYGKLYNYHAIAYDEICPDGWSVMTDDDFTDLELFLGLPELESDAMGWRGEYVGGNLKEMGTEHWLEPNLNAINISGYTALPSGYRDIDGQFYNVGSDYYVWALIPDQLTFRTRQLNYNENSVFRGDEMANKGYSIRCKKILVPEINTIPVTNITSYFVQSGGEILSDGGGEIFYYGIVWSTSPNPTLESNEGSTQFYGQGVKNNFNIINFEDFAGNLMPETTYYLRAYAVNIVGEAYGTEETFITLPEFICGENITFTYNGTEVTYGTVSLAGHCWLDRDLGATNVPLTIDDSNGYGDLFQWGREDDGHQSRLSTTTETLAPAESQPGHNQFIYNPIDIFDWNEDEFWLYRWTSDNDFNYPTNADPCPAGWHVPTQYEWEELSYSEYWITGDDAFNSLLKIPAGGERVGTNGVFNEGISAGYWTSNGSEGFGNAIIINQEYVDWWSNTEFSTGFSVRCILNTNGGAQPQN